MNSTIVSENTGEISTKALPSMHIEWKVFCNFLLSRDTKHSICSPSFQFKDSTWYLCVTMNDSKSINWGGTYGPIELLLMRKNPATSTLRVTYHMGIKTVDGKNFRSISGEAVFRTNTTAEHCCGTKCLLNRSDMCHQKFSLAPNGVLTFFCYLGFETEQKFDALCKTNPFKGFTFGKNPPGKISDKPGSQNTSSTGLTFGAASTEKTKSDILGTFKFGTTFTEKISNVQSSNQSTSAGIFSIGISKLLKDFKNLFINGEDSDVVIKVKDTEFKAHKNILRARSPVFYSMFSHNMAEKNNGTVDVIEYEPEAFKMFLIYLYNGSVENLSMNTIFDLYGAADKYDAEELKHKCKEFMVSDLTVDAVCDVIEHAIQYNEEDLLKTASNFFTKNYKQIILTVKWQSFMKRNTVAANELLIKASNFYVFTNK